MIITCRRNPALSRAEFFRHLRHVHWPLIQHHPDVLAAVPAYVQNHSVVPHAAFQLAAPYRIAEERDSVIELWFDGTAGIERLLSLPAYQQYVRPDEAAFNDLEHNIMLLTEATTIWRAPSVGRCKRFDFIRRAAGIDPATFRKRMLEAARQLSLDPFYTGHVDRHVENVAAAAMSGSGFGEGAFDGVCEVWAGSFEALSITAGMSAVDGADREKSFSVFATEFPMRRTIGED
jgi:hypothetical protein